MPIVEQITWYTPDERMPENKFDVTYLIIDSGETYTVGYLNGEFFGEDGVFCNVELWAYMPKGETDAE